MILRTVKLSSKGQVTLPADALRALGATKGSEFVFVQEGERILLIPAERAAELLRDELTGLEALALPAFADLWSSEADEVWNET